MVFQAELNFIRILNHKKTINYLDFNLVPVWFAQLHHKTVIFNFRFSEVTVADLQQLQRQNPHNSKN
jgi:hypothetical protein